MSDIPTHITNNLSAQNEGDDLVLILKMNGLQMKETLTPEQVCNLFIVWLDEASQKTKDLMAERIPFIE